MSEHDVDPRSTNPNSSGKQGLAGGMGVSSERVGPTGPSGTRATDGIRPTSPPPLPDVPDAPEERPGNPEENPVGIPPKEHDPARNPGHSHG
jgi:hypothetical protein